MRTLRTIAHLILLLLVAVDCSSGMPTVVFAADRERPLSGWPTWVTTEPTAGQKTETMLSPAPAEEALDPKLLTTWIERWTRPPTTLVWTDLTLGLIVKYQQNPVRAARALTLVHVAMSDAAVLAAAQAPATVAHDAAVHGAASTILAYLYPQELPGKYEAFGRSAAAAMQMAYPQETVKLTNGWAIGRDVAHQVIQRAMFDGADQKWDPQTRPRTMQGLWRSTPPLNMHNPIDPLAGNWQTWVLKNGAEIQPPLPIQFDSQPYWDEVMQVLMVAKQLTPEQRQIADRWNLDQGSVTPAGVWNFIAARLVREHAWDTAHTARAFAALNVAMMDALIACWHAKFTWWTQRPVTAIRDKLDPQFLPYLITPAFPSYVSGHATASGAAAEILQAFFPAHRQTLQAQAEEAALSRLYGGIHFLSDNQEGLTLGRKISERVFQRLTDSGTTR